MLSPREKVVAAVSAALGAPAPASVLCGSIDDRGRVAWVEDRDDIAFLRVAGGGGLLFERSLAVTDVADYGYEGCAAEELGWAGDHVFAITRERSSTRLFVFPPGGGAPAIRVLSAARLILDDAIVWAGDEPSLLRAMRLPGLGALTPLCFRGTARALTLGRPGAAAIQVDERIGAGERKPIDTLALPTAAQRALPPGLAGDDFLTLVERRLHDGAAAPPAARLVVESTALPFCRPPEAEWHPPVVWLPVYWHRHLAATGHDAEARDFLSMLDALAAPLSEDEPERGWQPEWDAVEGATALAARHVRRQARLLASVCREGRLPRGWWCLLFSPAPGSDVAGSRLAGVTLPRAARQVFEELAKSMPAMLPHAL